MYRAEAIWKGTRAESSALLAALAHHCTCQFADSGALVQACAAHMDLVRNQRYLDGLLYGRRLADRFRAEEWGIHTVR